MARKRRTDPVSAVDDVAPIRHRAFRPKNASQQRCWDTISRNTVIFITGPAGTAKTFCAMAWAMESVRSGKHNRVVLTRPVVEATESLGFLPGDVSQKIGPYMRPATDIAKGIDKEVPIEMIPLAYMRGLTLDSAVCVLDEAQNCNRSQLKLYLSRLGQDSKMIICGDIDQVDISNSGLLSAARALCDIEDIAHFTFTQADNVRHPLINKMLGKL